MMRMTLTLLAATGAAGVAALWLVERIDPETVAGVLARAEQEARAVAETGIVDLSGSVDFPVVAKREVEPSRDELDPEPARPSRDAKPVGMAKTAAPAVATAPALRVASPVPPLTVEEEHLTGRGNAFDAGSELASQVPGVDPSTARGASTEGVGVVPEDPVPDGIAATQAAESPPGRIRDLDPETEAALIRRMLAVYERTVEAE